MVPKLPTIPLEQRCLINDNAALHRANKQIAWSNYCRGQFVKIMSDQSMPQPKQVFLECIL